MWKGGIRTADKKKESKTTPSTIDNKRTWVVEEEMKDTDCPDKEGDNCKAPGVFNDSDPIGGG